MRAHAPPGFFSTEELLLAPNVLSALRLPLALAFPFAARSRGPALTVLALAAMTDVLDGWMARSRGQVTATGAVLDPIADKVFALSVVTTLIARRRIPAWGIPALLSREILEAPLLVWGLVARPHEEREVTDVRANVPGKIATVAQFAAVMAAIEAPALLPAALSAAAVAGLAAGVMYWKRELGRKPRPEAAASRDERIPGETSGAQH
jgi:CDP-diacylglycerol--glycerol-3-phosphate 3-phosphatidyltransferase/cardiolipin synthase